nr:serine beta-lactamase-like protein LACTB, mitochondrial isoform X2 [Cherax quadricarinatus]
MFHNICTPNIAHFGKQCFQTTKVLRTSCFLIPGSRHFHQEHTFKTANDCSIHRLGNSSNHYLFEINRERQKYRKRRFSYRNQMGMLCGIMGTAAVFGMGSALCETKDDVSDKDLSFNSAAAFTKLNGSSEEFLENKNSDQIGQDVVGTEKISSENQSSSSSANSQEVKITSVEEIVKKSRKLLKHCMEEGGAPGLTIAVSVDGKTAWEDGFGFADLENNVRCSPNTVMRIASISKSLTMAVVAKLWEDGKLDLDAPIQKYIPSFPVKTFNGEEVTITTRHLISHQSGIRHYKSRGSDKKEKEEEKKRTTTVSKNENMKGSSYLYTTLGWTVVSGVVEGAAGKPFTRVITRLFYDLGLENTYLDKNAPIIYNRARYYVRDKLGKLKNAPYVDNSYKWAGGGFLSTVQDLSKFGNIMLYASQQESGEGMHMS